MECCVVTDIKNGIGNILSEILVGLFFAKKLSIITGDSYNYYGLLTDRCMKGHSIIYNKEHIEFGLPHPLNLSAIFPDVQFIVQLPDNMNNYHYLHPIDINSLKDIKRLNICVDSITQLLLELKDNMDILNKISYNPNIYDYTRFKYNPDTRCLGIHVRLPQIGDYMGLRCPDIKWYDLAVKEAIRKNGLPNKIFLITGISTSRGNYSNLINEMLLLLNNQCNNIEIINVESEPYYIDMCILSLCGTIIITNSSFSLFAGLNNFYDKKTVIYPDMLSKEFGISNKFIFPGFHEIRIN